MVVMQDTLNLQSSTIMAHGTKSDITFVQALHDKYIDQEIVNNQFVLPRDEIISTDITLVGFGKVSSIQKQLKALISIDLSGRNIDSAGDIKLLEGSLNNVQILNLAENNLIWNEIIKIVSYLPNLKELILSKNPLIADEHLINYPRKPFRGLSTLTLGQIGLNWTCLVKILPQIWESIDQLDLWNNNLTAHDLKLQVCEKEDFVRKIRSLGLSHNYLCNLALADIGPMNSITELDISWCNLATLSIDSTSLTRLNNLVMLNISHNNIHDCSYIAQLNKLAKLKHLICFDNPFYNNDKLAKNFTIARVKNLKLLNREQVNPNVRRDSEILYVRKLFQSYKEYRDGRNASFLNYNTRYEELAQEYGLPEDIEEKVLDKYITVTLRCGKSNHKKKLPRDMSISNLQMLCRKLFRLKLSSKMEIECCDRDPTNNYILESKEQTLHFYSVRDGQELLLREID